MTNTEKKIAEIRNWCEIIHTGRVMTRAKRWLRFLLSELDREREENRKLREERNKLIEGLRKLAKPNAENIREIREWKAKQNDPEVIDLDWYNYVARDILKEIALDIDI